MTGLGERKQQATLDHLAEAARQGMIEHGLDVTVDEIARLAGVSRRTVFRHVATREDLLASALRATLSTFDEDLSRLDGEDWRDWLSRVCRELHRINARFGRPVWELLTRSALSPTLSTIAGELGRHRRTRNLEIADALWRAAGPTGPAPERFRAIVRTYLGPLFTSAVTRDAGGDDELAAALAESALLAAVESARRDHLRT